MEILVIWYDRDSRFVCINNNDFTVAANEPTPEPPDTITCEECFEENLTPVQFRALNELVEITLIRIPYSGEVAELSSLEDLCTLYSILPDDQILDSLEPLFQTVNNILSSDFPSEPQISEATMEEIAQCVIEALANEV